MFIKNVVFSLEKYRFGAPREVLHYVLNQELGLPRKNIDFHLETRAKERGGRAARCMGSVPVAVMLASETRGAPPGVGAQQAADDPTNSLSPGDRSRESCGT